MAIPNFMQWVVVTVGNGVFHMGWVANKADDQGLSTPGLGPTPAKVFHVMQGVALTSDQLAVFAAALVSAVLCGSSSATPGSASRCGPWSTAGIWPV